ncbi:MAG: hypothetical protein HKN32_01435 [Flavobacteriales bacterium]|nr:hypothetical protein [Flavobacteriales bacterium]
MTLLLDLLGRRTLVVLALLTFFLQADAQDCTPSPTDHFQTELLFSDHELIEHSIDYDDAQVVVNIIFHQCFNATLLSQEKSELCDEAMRRLKNTKRMYSMGRLYRYLAHVGTSEDLPIS